MNAYDLGKFFEQLYKGAIVSEESVRVMTDWFDLPEAYGDIIQFFQNGYGLENYKTQYGNGFGHEGGIDGFSALALYFPDDDATMVLLVNSFGDGDGEELIRIEILEAMFEN